MIFSLQKNTRTGPCSSSLFVHQAYFSSTIATIRGGKLKLAHVIYLL